MFTWVEYTMGEGYNACYYVYKWACSKISERENELTVHKVSQMREI